MYVCCVYVVLCVFGSTNSLSVSSTNWMEAPTSNHTSTNLYNREQEFSLAPPCHPDFSGCNQMEATTPYVQAPTWTSEDYSPP